MSEDRRQESALEDYLERRSGLSKAYRDASAEQPPAALDEAILAASRRAVGAGPRRVGWTLRLGAPLAAAAVLVLAVAVVLKLQDEPQIAQLKETQAPAGSLSRARSDMPGQPGEPDAARMEDSKRETAPETRSRGANQAGASDPAPARSIGKTQADTAPAPAAPPAALDEQMQADGARKSAPGRVVSTDAEAKSAAVGSGVAIGDDSMQSREQGETAAPASDASALRKQSAAASAAIPIPPGKLITQIEALYAEGRTEEGDRALREFCRAFPEHALPDSLTRQAARLGPDCGRRHK